MAEEKPSSRISLRRFATSCSEMGISVKNHTDVLIFHNPLEVDLAICFWTKANSPDGRRETAFTDFSSPRR
ncbi:MAG: hypothetical protein LUI12_09345 [Clostridiales bacterium]|nr:hypothetical protein [Clostridiales bacterium]